MDPDKFFYHPYFKLLTLYQHSVKLISYLNVTSEQIQ